MCDHYQGEQPSSVVMSGLRELSLGELPMETWMSHLPCALWDTPLYHLAIPGRLPYHITACCVEVVRRMFFSCSVGVSGYSATTLRTR